MFSFQALREIKSFSGRLKYITQYLEKLGSGSARTVFIYDDNSVIKLAKDKRGLAQNNVESDWSMQRGYSVITKIIDADNDNIFIHVERAKKITPTLFKKMLGFSIQEFEDYLKANNPRPSRYLPAPKIEPELRARLDEHEWVQEVLDLAMSYSFPIPGDLGRLSSYGIVNRDGESLVVLTDYGLTNEVYEDHYAIR